jgi:histone H3/H4
MTLRHIKVHFQAELQSCRSATNQAKTGLFKAFTWDNNFLGGEVMKKREFSLYDVEQFLREAGAERINEKAVISLEKEIEDTVKELVDEASMYADYAGRKSMIDSSDIELAQHNGGRIGARHPNIGAHALRSRPVRRIGSRRVRMQRLNELVQVRMLEQ